jgi:hypothetical protein
MHYTATFACFPLSQPIEIQYKYGLDLAKNQGFHHKHTQVIVVDQTNAKCHASYECTALLLMPCSFKPLHYSQISSPKASQS